MIDDFHTIDELDGQTFGEFLASIPVYVWILAVIIIVVFVVLFIVLAFIKNQKSKQQPSQQVYNQTVIVQSQNTSGRTKCDCCSATYHTTEHQKCPYCNK